MDKASEAILALKPVTFRYKEEIDPDKTEQFGLIAEEVEKVDPNLITRDGSGRPITVRYEAVNAMLLNEFLKEHRKVQELETIVAEQGHNAKIQREQIEALTAQERSAQIRKVNQKPGPGSSANLNAPRNNQRAPEIAMNKQ
jgi:hypothetical protein